MSVSTDLLDQARRQGCALHARVLSRDNLHLGPPTLSQAAARRLRRGLKALEAYLRRVLLWLALQLEHSLPAEPAPRRLYRRSPQTTRSNANIRFRIFPGARDFPPEGLPAVYPLSPSLSTRTARSAPVLAAPLLTRLSALKALIDAPEARARRLAWTLARRRHGWLLAPGRRGDVPARLGTEVSALYDSFSPAILRASQARPPPRGPAPRPPPRIRCL